MSEPRLDVVEAHEPAAAVHGHADDVEAQLARARAIGVRGEPDRGHGSDLALLARRDGFERRARARIEPARLDLDEDDRRVVTHDEVELTDARAVVAIEQPQPETLEHLEREILAE